MILLPYFVDSSTHTLGIFLCEGGKALWNVDDSTSVHELLQQNGLPAQWIDIRDTVPSSTEVKTPPTEVSRLPADTLPVLPLSAAQQNLRSKGSSISYPAVIHAEINHRLLKLGDFYLSTDPNVEEKDVWRLFQIPAEMWIEPEFHRVLNVLTGYLNINST